MLEVVTYATHSHGMFEELTKDGQVKVLGWGKKWNGFTDKYKGVLEYIQTLNDNDIIIFVDGFDTKILKSPEIAKQRFISMGVKVLFSKETKLPTNINKHIFGTCNGNHIANTGLYMGYVKYIIPILQDSIKLKCDDDQINLNSICKKYPYINVDINEDIFQNGESKNTNACFIQYNGTLYNPHHYAKLYASRAYPFILAFLLTLILIFPKYKLQIGIIILLLWIWFHIFAKKTC
jgi:hypothetical protein